MLWRRRIPLWTSSGRITYLLTCNRIIPYTHRFLLGHTDPVGQENNIKESINSESRGHL